MVFQSGTGIPPIAVFRDCDVQVIRVGFRDCDVQVIRVGTELQVE